MSEQKEKQTTKEVAVKAKPLLYFTSFNCVEWINFLSVTQLTVALVRSVWMAVDWAGHAMGGPAGVSNAEVNIKLHIQVNILLF